MVIPWSSSGFLDRQGPMFHCNFWAKAGNEIDNASASLFFAELAIVQYGEEKLYDAKVGELRVVSCEKLDGGIVLLFKSLCSYGLFEYHVMCFFMSIFIHITL